MSILTVENVSHSYGEKTILYKACFRLLKGEHVGLVGKNGIGKSTLLRLLTGELIHDEGKIEWFPHVKVGFLQQHTDLQEGITIEEYLQSAFSNLYAIECEMLKITEEMSEAEDVEKLLVRYGELQTILESSNFYQIHTEIEEVAMGLGLFEVGMKKDVSKLSGGQRTKLLLGKLLLEKADVLLLDEPTNYLDTAHIEWLQTYLKLYEKAYIIISHDEVFLNKITNIIYHLEERAIKRYVGDYNSFVRNYELQKKQLQAAYTKQQKEITQLETFIQKNKIRKAKQAKSREKVLEKMQRVEKVNNVPRARFDFNVYAEPVSRILQAEKLRIGYSEPLFPELDFQVKKGEKIAIVGHNGIGKTTMLKTLLGKIKPLSGLVSVGDRVNPAYFAQEEFASEITPLEKVWAERPDMTRKEVRQALAKCGLKEEHVLKPICLLSGGEQTKVRLCELIVMKSNVLILDEPTNHLDIETKQALQEALQQYKGTVLIVSHEPSFYEAWITKVWSIEEWNVEQYE
ncbi:ABC transporter ATP-binding protein [Bacillus cereus]|uniref:ABC transporter ATP-binding protein n=1 Tax=Bacillus cereus TaxID=1396 RepID=A0A2B2GNS2_BACCE|nr:MULTISPECIES: ABC-F family ATP-binding cassette domain-containing protein [Bacillus cereus group]MDR4986465.1 ABC-F family ATP-binding cassette domain-containing protein [Bacillus cereus]MEA1012081.1 ABC-F family ATP-binding cassette domain-containing protein [Bacillus cereus]PES90191.1 ABC transporter ATP-binding protein [Bacillus cereus]PFP82775.1 ABC transporter ATP-binding protein [Bacillus cereus]PGT12350.1 ABC transporter ATP-binding protein [Bacillus cereus]